MSFIISFSFTYFLVSFPALLCVCLKRNNLYADLEKKCDFLQIINRSHIGLMCLNLTQFVFLFYSSPWNCEVYVVVNLSKNQNLGLYYVHTIQ